MSYEALIAKQAKRLAKQRERAAFSPAELKRVLARAWAGTVQNQIDNQRNDGKSDR